MKSVSMLLLLTAMLPNFAHASETDAETLYLALCQPSFEKAMSKEDREEAQKLRPQFLAFLRNPAPTVNKLAKSSLVDPSKASGFEALGPILVYASTCGIAEVIDSRVKSLGCTDAKGRSYSTAKAVKLCAPLTAAVKKQQEETEGEQQ